MDWWRAIWPATGIALFIGGLTLLGVSWQAVESAQASRHLTMNNPATWVAVTVVVLGLVIFYLGITDSRWLPGGRRARERESNRDFGHNVREMMGDTPEGRMRKAMERHTDVLERWLREQSKD